MSGLSVSAIIPAFRAAGTIGRAVDSLLGQTRAPDEILVIDDGSPDDLATALRPYGARVTIIRKANGGAASARNLGIERAHGDLIAFIDADDYWESTKLERQLEVFECHPEVGLAATRYFIQPPGQPRQISSVGDERYRDRVLAASGACVFDLMTAIWTSTVVVRREALGDRRFVPGLEPAEDRELWIQLIVSCPVYLDSAPLATWVLEPGSLSRSNIDRDCSNMLRVIHRHGDLLSRRRLSHWEADIFRRWAAGHLSRGRPEAALKPAWRRLRYQPFSAQAWWILLKCMSMARFAGCPAPARD